MSGETQFLFFHFALIPNSGVAEFNRGKIVRTIPRKRRSMHIAIDVDQRGEVIGIEAVGVTEFSLGKILQQAGVKAPNINPGDVRFRPVERVAA